MQETPIRCFEAVLHSLEVMTFATQVFIDGEGTAMRSRQTLLRGRYPDLGRKLPPAYVRPRVTDSL